MDSTEQHQETDEQAVEISAKNNANNVVETETELTVTRSGQCSERYLEMGTVECVRNINTWISHQLFSAARRKWTVP
ncbi:hypothetical protein T4B_309 [Trichinella pseudospiralis]|uniref:Uncharacterized protein n=1 Tax=Trichinella pseudospiralis TaxID=6337 RepID=A0A0V1IMQ8_TRIPS|nr:hypothetical protein T4B_10995 [Trichinella pseudospiralis]KRZ06804.1 hypothetical protein T4B_309 [Trichinella pseudospiralis]KRZ23958.1 hypothetical protein T4C_10803 [Trichinella pseudospiralis]KRZ24110.1 hypothetical protein T4C_4549 [Trichinella pseudospiralis]